MAVWEAEKARTPEGSGSQNATASDFWIKYELAKPIASFRAN
ncbi:hypothetical protein [Pedobacter sp. NJ-S-72]